MSSQPPSQPPYPPDATFPCRDSFGLLSLHNPKLKPFLLQAASVGVFFHRDGNVTYTILICPLILFGHTVKNCSFSRLEVSESFSPLQIRGWGCVSGSCPLFCWLSLTHTVPCPHTTDTVKIMTNFLSRIPQRLSNSLQVPSTRLLQGFSLEDFVPTHSNLSFEVIFKNSFSQQQM